MGMRRSIFLISLLALLTIIGGCRSKEAPQPPVRDYQMRGRVESIDIARKRLTIAHEDIEGYMKAMTMSFAVPGEADGQLLGQLKAGDRLEARVIHDTRTNLTWIEHLNRIR